MKTYLLCGAALVSLAAGTPVLAQSGEGEEIILANVGTKPEIIVAAARESGVAIDDFTGSVTVITADQLEERQTRNIEDVLRDVPGVAVSSLPGQTQIRLRGSEANHVLVLVDGLELSDPGSGEYDLGTLQAEIGSRIEVLRGPQSALYGSEAIGGVIAYDSGRFDGVAVRLEGGSDNTINGAARWGVVDGGLAASLSATLVSTDGQPNARGGTRDIGRDSYTLSGKIAGDVTEALQLRAIARYTRTEGAFNEQDFTFGSPTEGFVIDSPGTRFESEAFSALVGARLETMDGAWVHDLSAQITEANRETAQPTGFPSATESDRFKASYVSAYSLGSAHTLTFAAEYEVEGYNNVLTFDDRKSSENIGFVGEYRYAGGAFDFSAAVRHDVNDLFKDATTFRVGAAYHLTNSTRLRAAAGTGVKNPTLSELFGFFDGVFIGNPDLEPEESTSWEVGFDQSFADDAAMLSVTYFNAELDREIFTSFPPPDFIATPGNRTTKSEQRGIEVALSAQIGPQWSLNAAYTWLDAEENGATEVRRPETTASAAITWTAPGNKASATLVLRHNGEMLDSDFTTGAFPAPVTTLDDFTLVNINALYELAEGLELFARAGNLLDEDYEQVFTFVSPGRSVVAGFSAKF